MPGVCGMLFVIVRERKAEIIELSLLEHAKSQSRFKREHCQWHTSKKASK